MTNVVAAYGHALEPDPMSAASCVTGLLTEAVRWTVAGSDDQSDAAWSATVEAEEGVQAKLLRHIVGNPFRPFPAPPTLPAAVVQLAAALEAGEPVTFALRDALLDAGQAELAEHFAGDEPHPLGCWALDVIGGRA